MLGVQKITVRCYFHIHVRLSKLTLSEGAPECYRSDEFLEQIRVNVRPSVDIWSFGGVCSEAAVWIVLGTSGLDEYRYRRQQEIIAKDTLQDGSCFHDGEKVLETVEAMHQCLSGREEVRQRDHVTKPILDHMVTSMLEVDPEVRQNAIWLWKKWQKILREAQSELGVSHQPYTPYQKDSAVAKAQIIGQNSPDIHQQTSHKAVEPSDGNPHPNTHSPPPNYPQYSSNFQKPGRPSGKEVHMGRSDTWHEHNTRPNMTVGLPNENLFPPVAKGSRRADQTPGTSTIQDQS